MVIGSFSKCRVCGERKVPFITEGHFYSGDICPDCKIDIATEILVKNNGILLGSVDRELDKLLLTISERKEAIGRAEKRIKEKMPPLFNKKGSTT